ncbi:MAG TPA: IS5 family transposase [Pyrinomonadaceae bacterium]|nr:IS5 family transposase [Pyrinomonadaceae bacterium]
MTNQTYPTDLTDSQWDHIKDLLPAPKSRGRPRTMDLRQVINALLYVLVGGIQWRMMPRDFPKWQSVYYSFRQWQRDGRWQRIHDTLHAQVRVADARHKHPTAGCLDSQSVKTTSIGDARGFDSGKRVKGRKRHILVDTMGLLLAVAVTAASVSENQGAKVLFQHLGGCAKKLRLIWVDGGYKAGLFQWVKDRFRFRLQQVLRCAEQKSFHVLPRRWVVERTFAWLNNCRRLSKDYEVLTQTGEAFIYIAMTRLMLRRLKPL